MKWLAIVIVVIWVTIGIIAVTRRKATTPPPGTPGTPGTTPATPTSRVPAWLKTKEIWIGLGAAVVVPLAILLVFWLLVPGAAEWMADRPKMSAGIGVVVSLVVLCGLIPYKTMRGVAIFGLVATLLTGIMINIPDSAKPEWSKEVSAQASSSSSLPRSGEKVIEAPVSQWSEFIKIPDHSWYLIDEGIGHKVKRRNALGEERILDGETISNQGQTSDDPRAKMFQVQSLENEPVPVTFSWGPK
jgi:hypothetical protein